MGEKDKLMAGYSNRGSLPIRKNRVMTELEEQEAQNTISIKESDSTQQKVVEEKKDVVSIENIDVPRENKDVKEKRTPSNRVKKEKASEEKLEQLGIKYYDETDRNFLRDACRVCGYRKMNEFFASLIEDDAKLKDSQIDVTDENHRLIIAKKPLFGSSTVKVTARQRQLFREQAQKHVLNDGEYAAYLIHEKRMRTPGWNN